MELAEKPLPDDSSVVAELAGVRHGRVIVRLGGLERIRDLSWGWDNVHRAYLLLLCRDVGRTLVTPPGTCARDGAPGSLGLSWKTHLRPSREMTCVEPLNEAGHRMSGNKVNLKLGHRGMPLIGALVRSATDRRSSRDTAN